MKYAVLQSGGKQYKVAEGMEIEVDKLESSIDSDHKFDKVLLYVKDGVYQLGRPHIDGASVTGRVLEQKKGVKIRVAKFKAKARYRRVQGHRQLLTKLKITKISVGQNKEIKEPEVKSLSKKSKTA